MSENIPNENQQDQTYNPNLDPELIAEAGGDNQLFYRLVATRQAQIRLAGLPADGLEHERAAASLQAMCRELDEHRGTGEVGASDG